MAYSNGFNITPVLAALAGRLGWRQPTLAGMPVVDATNIATKSGRYFNDFHALVNVPNAKATVENPEITDTQFNAYLQSLQSSVIMRCLNGVFNKPEWIEKIMLFDRFGQDDELITNAGLFVGVKIRTARSIDKAVKINSVSLYFDSAVTFNLYLFHDARKTPVMTVSVTTVANQQTILPITEMILTYLASGNMGGNFYLGYFQEDLGAAKAYDEKKCKYNRAKIFSWDFMEANKVAAQVDFERNNPRYTARTHGLNLSISSFNDHTQAIVDNVPVFDELIGLQMAATLIEMIMHSTRSNGTERIIKDSVERLMVYMDLKGTVPISDAPSTTGIAHQIERELVRVKETVTPKPKPSSYSLC